MSLKNDDFSAIAELCQKSDFGKRLPNALYIHVSALERLDPLLSAVNTQKNTIALMQIFLSKITG